MTFNFHKPIYYVNVYGIVGEYFLDKDQTINVGDLSVLLTYSDCVGKTKYLVANTDELFYSSTEALDHYENKTRLDNAEGKKIIDKEIENIEKSLKKIKEVREWIK